MRKILFCLMLVSTQVIFAQDSYSEPVKQVAQGEQTGIGVHLKMDTSEFYGMQFIYPKIIDVLPGSPAEAAGLLAGDIINYVDSSSCLWSTVEDTRTKIIGTKGTVVRISIERNNDRKEFLITRGYNLSVTTSTPSYTTSSSSSGDFCSALSTLMTDATNNFKTTKDTNHVTRGEGYFALTTYESFVSVPGAKKVTIAGRLGLSAIIEYGSFNSMEDGKTAADKIYKDIQDCFSNYYASTALQKSDSVRVYFGREYSDGYESGQLELTLFSDGKGAYNLTLKVFGGEVNRYYTISTYSYNNDFTKSMLTIYNDIPKKYAHVKGKKHESEGFFSTVSYEIRPMPEGAHDCTLNEGGLSLGNGCNCRYSLGSDYAAALSTFNQLSDAMKNALGSEFTYVTKASQWDMTAPDKAEGLIIFGKKKQRVYESLPLIGLSMTKESDGRYLVQMFFYDFGI